MSIYNYKTLSILSLATASLWISTPANAEPPPLPPLPEAGPSSTPALPPLPNAQPALAEDAPEHDAAESIAPPAPDDSDIDLALPPLDETEPLPEPEGVAESLPDLDPLLPPLAEDSLEEPSVKETSQQLPDLDLPLPTLSEDDATEDSTAPEVSHQAEETDPMASESAIPALTPPPLPGEEPDTGPIDLSSAMNPPPLPGLDPSTPPSIDGAPPPPLPNVPALVIPTSEPVRLQPSEEAEADQKEKALFPIARNPAKQRLNKSFNYKREILPPYLYKANYSATNKHLPTIQTEQKWDQLMLAAIARDDLNALRALSKQRPLSGLRNAMGDNPLILAVRAGAAKSFVFLLHKMPSYVNQQNKAGLSALHYAAYANQLPIAEALLKSGADPMLPDQYGKTAMDYAAGQHHTSMAHLIAFAAQRHLALVE